MHPRRRLSDRRVRDHLRAAAALASAQHRWLHPEPTHRERQRHLCLDAFTAGAEVVPADLREATPRWPIFAPHAARLGFRSVHAIPLRLRTDVIGAMNLFGTDGSRLDPDDRGAVQGLADMVTFGVLQGRAVVGADILAAQLEAALNSRVVVEQARGAVSRMYDIDIDAAFTLLWTYARNHNHRLADLARDIVTHPDSLLALSPAGP